MFTNKQRFNGGRIRMLFFDVTKQFTLTTANQRKTWTLTTANRMLRNCQEDKRICYDIREKSYDKYDPCYVVPNCVITCNDVICMLWCNE